MNAFSIKRLKLSASITLVLGIFSAIAVLFTFLALCDIGNQESDQTLEWFIVGIGLIIWVAFIVSTLVTIRFLFGHLEEQSKLN